MIDEKLMRRISDALATPDGIDGDPELRAVLAQNPHAVAYAEDLRRLGEVTAGWALPVASAEEASALSERVMARLDEAGKLFGDYTQAPKFDDPYSKPPPSDAQFSVGNLDALSVDPAADGDGSKRPSLPPLPQPTGERVAVPDVAPVPLASGIMFSSAPAEDPVVEPEPPPVVAAVSRMPRWLPIAAAAGAIALGAVFALRGGAPDDEAARSESAGATGAPAAKLTPEPSGELEALDEAPPLAAGTGGPAGGGESPTEPTGTDTPKVDEPATASPAKEATPSSDGASKARTARPRTAARKAASTEKKSGGGSLQDSPSKDDVLTAMRAVEPRVLACRTGRHGVMTVRVTVAGATGKVQSAVATGSFAGSPEGDCASRAVRGAKFPKFTKPTFTVAYPYRF